MDRSGGAIMAWFYERGFIMKFWKEHMGLRALLIGGFFFAGLALVIYGWTLTGKMSGLGLMVLGVVFLLTALMVYNKPFEGDKGPGL